jgi:ornithine decarboxylase
LKTNYEVGKVLEKETDCFFSVHNMKELEKVRDVRRVWFFVLATSNRDLEALFDKGVENFVVDLKEDVAKLLGVAAKKRQKINLLLRIRLKENTIFTGKHYVWGMESKVVNQLIPDLRKNQSVKKLGVHAHRKTQNVSEWNLKEELEEFILPENLHMLDVINIGGGIPGKYKNTNDRAVPFVLSKIREVRDWFHGELFAEPGRPIASYAVDLECSIIAVQDDTIFVNVSIFNSAMDTVVYNIKLLVDGELPEGRGGKYTIKGCSPCSEDILRYEVFLKEPKVGDTIRFLNAGAYNYTTDFCCLDKIETVVVD